MYILSNLRFSEASVRLLREAAPGAVINFCDARAFDDAPPDALARAEVLYTRGGLPQAEHAPALRWVQSHSAGIEGYLSHPLITSGQARLTTASGVHAINMGEYALMAMLMLAHNAHNFSAMKAARVWRTDDGVKARAELHGATLGLIGYGAIGRHTARLAQAFGMRVMALRASATAADPGVTLVTRDAIDDLLSAADYLVVLAPLTEQTRGMLGAREIARLKPGACVINLARGAIIDEAALIEALRSGRLGGAVLDVFEREPLPDDSPLWTLDNVILSPHIAGVTPRYEERAVALFAENLRRYRAGETLRNEVVVSRGY